MPAPRYARLIAAVLLCGAALQALLWSRQWIYGDQYALLLAGIEFADTHRLPAHAKGTSGGGVIPGGLLPMLVGLPLEWWRDYRAPGLLIALWHGAAVALLCRCVLRGLGPGFLAAYLAVYWLSPWRLYHAGFIWEPAYVFLPAAAHLAAAYELRDRPRFGWSMVLGASLVISLQLHTSFVILVLLTVLLAWRRLLRLDAAGALAGLAAGGMTLLPTVRALLDGTLPRMAPQETEELARVVVGGLNLLKSLAYWPRLGSPDIGRRLRQAADGPVETILVTASIAAVAIALAASWRYFRADATHGGAEGRAAWFRRYAAWSLVAMCAAAAVSPVPLQGWHLVIAFHAACLPVAAWLHGAFAGPSRVMQGAAVAFVMLQIAIVLVLAFGHPMFTPARGDDLQRQDIPDRLRPLVQGA